MRCWLSCSTGRRRGFDVQVRFEVICSVQSEPVAQVRGLGVVLSSRKLPGPLADLS